MKVGRLGLLVNRGTNVLHDVFPLDSEDRKGAMFIVSISLFLYLVSRLGIIGYSINQFLS